jgi:hypothetical protein
MPIVDYLSSLLPSPLFPPLLSEVLDMGVPKDSSSSTGNEPFILPQTQQVDGKGVGGRAAPTWEGMLAGLVSDDTQALSVLVPPTEHMSCPDTKSAV